MVKAEELRLGNLVRLSETSPWASEHAFDMFSVNRIEHRNEKDFPNSNASIGLYLNERITFHQFNEFVSPIDMSEMWLPKMGFRLRSNHTGHGSIYDMVEQVGDEWHEKMAVAVMEKGYKGAGIYILNSPTHRAIQYVHEFQNAVFSIMGTELQIKL